MSTSDATNEPLIQSERAETSRRSFLKSLGVTAPAIALGGGAGLVAQTLPQARHAEPASKAFVAIQLGARAFVDEGVESVLDALLKTAAVNVIMPAVYTYGEGMAGRQMRGQPATDHGIQEYAAVVGGAYTRQHLEFYTASVIKDVRAPELGNFDILADVIPKAKQRGIKTYALFEEKYNPRLIPNFPKIAEVDIYVGQAQTRVSTILTRASFCSRLWRIGPSRTTSMALCGNRSGRGRLTLPSARTLRRRVQVLVAR